MVPRQEKMAHRQTMALRLSKVYPTLLRQSGQATVEAIGASVLILTFSLVLLICCYLGSIKIFSEYLLHEALICSATVTIYIPQENCQKSLITQMKKILIFQKIENTQWKKSKNSISLSIKIAAWNPFSLPGLRLGPWTLKKSLALPLRN
jgi:hypothetical protein